MKNSSCYIPHKADDAEYTRSCITVMRYSDEVIGYRVKLSMAAPNTWETVNVST